MSSSEPFARKTISDEDEEKLIETTFDVEDINPPRYAGQGGVRSLEDPASGMAGSPMSEETPEEQNAEYTFEEQDVSPNLDPQLQHVIMTAQQGRLDSTLMQEAADGSLHVDVLAVLEDPTKAVPGLNVSQVIGDVVTGSCEVGRIQEVHQNPNVISLKGATKVEPNLRFSVPEIRASQQALRDALPSGMKALDGTGVVVGIVDFGCDFAHQNFRNADGTSRVLFLWDQSGQKTSMSPAGFDYGREFGRAHLNQALRNSNPYQFLSYDPELQAHGTHVMDIAAGNGRGTGSAGVAPKADIIFVQLAVEALTPSDSFGNSRRLLEAVKYIFDKASQLGRPAVINLSLGTHGGPHDGSTPAERGLDKLLETPGRAIVISAGNSFQRRSHASGTIAPQETRVLGWEKFQSDMTANEVEIWYNGDAQLEVTLVFPGGQRFGPTPLGALPRAIMSAGQKVGEVIHRAKDPLNKDNVINIFIGTPLPSGVWKMELRATGTKAANFHAWIERDDDRLGPDGTVFRNQSKFVDADEDSTHTLGSISCGRNTIVVGSYNARVLGRDLSEFSSEGPTRDGKQKPEVSAPGQTINAAASRSGDGVIPMSGTSMAAPHVTGMTALLMQAAPRPLTIAEIRQALTQSARHSPPLGSAWHSRYGNGRIDGVATVLTQVPNIPALVPDDASLAKAGVETAANGFPFALGQFLNALTSNANKSRVCLRVELEVEPMA